MASPGVADGSAELDILGFRKKSEGTEQAKTPPPETKKPETKKTGPGTDLIDPFG